MYDITKSDIIEYYHNLPSLLTYSIYFTKLVYILIAAADNTKWTKK